MKNKNRLKKEKIFFLISTLLITSSINLFGFGLRTHIVIGQEILKEVNTGNCKLGILDKKYAMNRDVCNAIKNYNYMFLSGVLGPDIYPDMFVGQTTTHPGVEDDWQTDDWLKHFISNAKTSEEKAFAYGVLVHASSDILAHTYVNAYSGGIFELTDEDLLAIERRHFVLEKYIDKHLPKFDLDIGKLTVPANYLRDTFIFNEDAEEHYKKVPKTTSHLISLYRMKKRVQVIRDNATELEMKLQKDVTTVAGKINKLAYDIGVAEPAVITLKESTRITRLGIKLYIDSVERQKELIKNTKKRNNVLIKEMEKGINTLTDNINSIIDNILKVLTLDKYKDSLKIAKTNLNNLKKTNVRVMNTLNNALDILRRELSIKKTVLLTQERALKRWENDLKLYENGLVGEKEYQQKLLSLVNKNSPKLLAKIMNKWLNSMDISASKYIETSLEVSKSMLKTSTIKPFIGFDFNSSDTPIKLYTDWSLCYGQVFMGMPIEVLNGVCKVREDLSTNITDYIKQPIDESLPQEIKELQKKINEGHENLMKNINISQYLTSVPIVDFASLISNPANATKKKLNDVYSNSKNSGNKNLLMFPKVSELIDKDLGIKDMDVKMKDIKNFNALNYAIKLSKISLLSAEGLNNMIHIIGGKSYQPKKYQENKKPFSALFNWVKSLDGNHQWGVYGIPYVHENGYSKENPKSFGLFGKDKGFKLFQDPELRKNVFLKIFPKPIGGEVVLRSEYSKNQPFPSSEINPFPVTFEENGSFIKCEGNNTINCFPE